MSGDRPQCKIGSNRAGEADERECRVSKKQIIEIFLLLTVAIIVMHFLSYAITGLLAQVVSVFQSCVGLITVAYMLLVLRVAIVKRSRLSDVAIRVGRRVIRFGDPPIADKRLFSRLEGLFRTYRSATQDMVESIAQLETFAKARQQEIREASAMLDALHLEESLLRDSILALHEAKPEVVLRFREVLEGVLESKERRKQPVEILYLFLGAFLGVVLGVLFEAPLSDLFDRIETWFGIYTGG